MTARVKQTEQNKPGPEERDKEEKEEVKEKEKSSPKPQIKIKINPAQVLKTLADSLKLRLAALPKLVDAVLVPFPEAGCVLSKRILNRSESEQKRFKTLWSNSPPMFEDREVQFCYIGPGAKDLGEWGTVSAEKKLQFSIKHFGPRSVLWNQMRQNVALLLELSEPAFVSRVALNRCQGVRFFTMLDVSLPERPYALFPRAMVSPDENKMVLQKALEQKPNKALRSRLIRTTRVLLLFERWEEPRVASKVAEDSKQQLWGKPQPSFPMGVGWLGVYALPEKQCREAAAAQSLAMSDL